LRIKNRAIRKTSDPMATALPCSTKESIINFSIYGSATDISFPTTRRTIENIALHLNLRTYLKRILSPI